MYEFEAGKIPALPPDYVKPPDVTEIQLLEQNLLYQQKVIEYLYYDLNQEVKEYEILQKEKEADELEYQKQVKQAHDDSALLAEKLDTLIEQSSSGDSVLTDSNTQILQKLDNLNETASLGSSAVLSYGVLYIPLAIIIFALYKFFWSFLRPLR